MGNSCGHARRSLRGDLTMMSFYCTAMMITRMITGIVADFPLPRFCMDRAGIQDKVGYGRN